MVWLSKSSIGTYKQCPLRYKYAKVDKLPEPKNKYLERGINIHLQIEEFYANIKYENGQYTFPDVPPELEALKWREETRAKNCEDKKYFFPVFQELTITNSELKLKGIIDVVFYNKDGTYTLLDWKSGKIKDKTSMRKELWIYKMLLEQSGKIDGKVSKFGMYFTDQDELFMEVPKEQTWNCVLEEINKVRKGIEEKKFDANPGILCRWCGYFKTCEFGDKKDEK